MGEKNTFNGRVFGYLQVIDRCDTPDKNKYTKNKIFYRCLCKKCGCIVCIRKDALIHETMCIDCSRKSRNGVPHPRKGQTMIKKIGAYTKSNTSGVVGVNWDKSRNKWQASIRYKSKRYHLGRFENFDEAVQVRKSAEEKIKSYEQKKQVKKL